MDRLRTIALVAIFDFFESVRSWKAVGLLVLYVAGAIGATAIFIRILKAIEEELARALQVSPTEKAGTMTVQLFESPQFQRMMEGFVGDPELAQSLLSMPPLALFYFWLALTFIPFLTTLTACDTVSSETSSGSVRFALFRADRFSWALGKLTGQAMLMTVGIFAGATATYILGAIFMASFEAGPTAWWLARLSGRAWFYGFAFLGLTLGVSQVTRSIWWSRGLALLVYFGIVAFGAVLGWDFIVNLAPAVIPRIQDLMPAGHWQDLWYPGFVDRLPAMLMLTALGAGFFGLGFWRFSTRDA